MVISSSLPRSIANISVIFVPTESVEKFPKAPIVCPRPGPTLLRAEIAPEMLVKKLLLKAERMSDIIKNEKRYKIKKEKTDAAIDEEIFFP